MSFGVFQIVKPIKFKDEEEKNCIKYYVREVFDKNNQLNIKPAILCHESWIDLLKQNTKCYEAVKEKINLPEINNIVFEPSMEFGYFTKFENSAFISCTNLTYKEITKRFEEISGGILDIDKVLSILNEFYKSKKIKSFNILKPQAYALEKNENVYVIEIGRFIDDFKSPDISSTKFYRNVRLRKKSINGIVRK
jgi:hypothetical protein